MHAGRVDGPWGRYRHARFMPRWVSRFTLTVTDVRVQRLQDISEEDAVAEGVEPLFDLNDTTLPPECRQSQIEKPSWKNYLWHGHIGKTITGKQSDLWVHQYSDYASPIGSYSSLWEMINGTQSWDANPWVVAISFDVRRGNIDEVPL